MHSLRTLCALMKKVYFCQQIKQIEQIFWMAQKKICVNLRKPVSGSF